jgi:hypothetical protein
MTQAELKQAEAVKNVEEAEKLSSSAGRQDQSLPYSFEILAT